MGWIHAILDVSTVFRSWLGLGFISMPLGFVAGGWLSATLILVFLAAGSMYCAALLIKTKYLLVSRGSTCVSYGDVVTNAFGAGRGLVDGVLFFTHFGFCVSYCMFILGTFENPFKDGPSILGFKFSVKILLTCVNFFLFLFVSTLGFCSQPIELFRIAISRLLSKVLILIFALCPFMFVDMKVVSQLSFLGSVSMLGALGLCFGLVFDWNSLATLATSSKVEAIKGSGIPLFIGMAANAMCGIGFVLPFEVSLQERQQNQIEDYSASVSSYAMRVIYAAVGVCCVVLVSFGMLGSQTYGESTMAVLTLNLDRNARSTVWITHALALSIFVTCPAQFVVLRNTSERWIYPVVLSADPWLRAGWRISLCVFLVVLAAHFPDFGLLSGVIGATGGIILAYVMPLLSFMRVQRAHLTNNEWGFHLVLASVAIITMIM